MLLLSSAASRWLLDLARSAVAAAGRREALPSPQIPPELPASDRHELEQARAAFVSLHKQGRLRGCVGHVGFDTPLLRLVPEIAEAAASHDARFPPVSAEELPDIHVEISVLSPLFPIRPEEIVPGTHGLLVSRGFHRGLLLPQVATAAGWDSLRFLRETCRKAGLDPDAWQHGATLEAFTADVISE